MSLHVPHPHVPHLQGPHLHVGSPHIEEHPWRALPIALGMILILAVVLIVVSFALSKWLTGNAY
jgi:hypothetical protein